MTFTFNWKYFFSGSLLVVVDIAVYICLGIAMMNYDDFYDGPPEHYGDWNTLSGFDKKVVIGMYIWNIVNILVVIFIIIRFVKQIRRNKNRYE